MPPSLILAVLLIVPSSLSIANVKTPRHVPAGSGQFAFDSNAAGASSFASSSSYASGGSFGGSGGVKGGCGGGCGGSSSGVGVFAGSGIPGKVGFGGTFGGAGSAGAFSSSGSDFLGGNFPDLSNAAFWWAGPDSPFKQASEYYRRCALKGDCSGLPGPFNSPGFGTQNFPGSFIPGDKTHPGKGGSDLGPIDISKNPFLNGNYKGVAISSCSGNACPGGKPHVTVTNCKGTACKTVKHEGEPSGSIDISGNPFLSGAFAGSGAYGSGSTFGGSSSGSSFKGSHGAGSNIGGKPGAFDKPGQSGETPSPTPGHSGSTTGFSNAGSFGVTGSQHGKQPYPGQNEPGHGSGTTSGFPGSQQGQQPFPTSYPGQSGTTSFHKGSSSFASSGSAAGSFGTTVSGGSQHGQQPFPTSYPGQQPHLTSFPGQGVNKPTDNSYPGHGNAPDYIGSQQGKQPGSTCYPGQACAGGSQPGQQPTSSYPGQDGRQPGSSCAPGQSCSQTGQKPNCYPGQPCAGGSQPGHQTIPSTYPGQDGSQPSPSCTPGQPCAGGSQPGHQTIPSTYPGQDGRQPSPSCAPGQPCAGGSQPGHQTIPSTYPGQDGRQPSPSCAPGQPCVGGAQPGHQTIPSTYPGQEGRQPFPSTYPGGDNRNPSQGCQLGKPCSSGIPQQSQPIPTTYPGQLGQKDVPLCYAGQDCSGKSPDTYPGSKTPGQPQSGSKPTCYPGQPCSSGSQTYPTGQPAFTSGYQHAQSGSTAFSGSQSGSTSFTTSPFGQKPTVSGPGSPYGQNTPSGGSQPSYEGGFPNQGYGKTPGSDVDGELTLRCGGAGYICVEKYLCNNGIVNKNGEGLFQTRQEEQFCNVNTQVCCRLPNAPSQPHKKPELNIPGNNFFSTASHSSSAASSAATSSNSFFTSSGPSPTSAGHIANRYTPGKSAFPDSSPSGTGQPGLIHVPPKDSLRPGQTIPFGGSDGNSPGLIHVLPEGSTARPYSTGPGLIHIPPGQNPKPGQTFPIAGQPGNSPGLIHVLPEGSQDLPRPFTSGPNYVQVSPNGGSSKPGLTRVTPSANEITYKDIQNELSSAATVQGPAYLPPDASPTPNSYTPDLIPPYVPQQAQPSSPGPTIYVPPKPSTYYPQPTPSRPTPQQPNSYFPSTTKRPQVYRPPQTGAGSDNNNEYLPPDGTSIVSTALIPQRTTQKPYYTPQSPDSNIIKINVLKPPGDINPDSANDRETRLRPPTNRPRPVTEYPFQGDLNTTPYPGCAAALKCVKGEFCTAEGVISPVQVVLTKEQEINRVPTTDCSDPESGITGKCCRDPDYKDPWPASQLGLYNPDNGFDNGQYKETKNEGKFTNPGGVKGGAPPGVKGGRPQRPFSQEPNQIGSPSNNPNSFARPEGYPSQVPGIPFDYRQVNPPLQVDVTGPVEVDLNDKYPISASKISSQNCGLRKPGGKPKGPGPIDVDFAEIPWQAMILRDSNRSLLCGGAIIRQNAVLTAAHCVEGLTSDDVLVKGGEWRLGIDEEPKPFQIIKVATIVRHPGYRPDNKFNDVAILILAERFRLDKNIDTICLPSAEEDIQNSFQNSKCITTGWGKTILQLHVLNSIMHSLDVGVVSPSQCQSTLQQYHSQSAPLYNTNCICGATKQPNADICDVDIGSALACDRGDGHFTLAGVYSWDTGCGSKSQLAGYTKVDILWIETQLQRPINDLKTEESGFYQRLYHDHAGPDCHCQNGK